MRTINIASELDYEVKAPTSFVFSIASATNDHQRTFDEQLVITPGVEYEWCELNEFGTRGIRLNADEGPLHIAYSAKVSLSPDVEKAGHLDEVEHKTLPTEVLPFLNPSRYCESDRLSQMAYKEFGELESGYFRVEAICDWVYNNIDYVSGSTDASSGACDVLIQRQGVCRDFAHVGIALCRALGIPARYVSGYAAQLEPPDFHGFFEAYLNKNWYLFDATKMAPVAGFVRVGMGRDAADTCFANIVGQASLANLSVSAHADDENITEVANEAISTA